LAALASAAGPGQVQFKVSFDSTLERYAYEAQAQAEQLAHNAEAKVHQYVQQAEVAVQRKLGRERSLAGLALLQDIANLASGGAASTAQHTRAGVRPDWTWFDLIVGVVGSGIVSLGSSIGSIFG